MKNGKSEYEVLAQQRPRITQGLPKTPRIKRGVSANPKTKGPVPMSPNVGNFVHDLVEMARATEELPRIQASLEDANRLIDEQGKTIQSRELRIMDLKAELDEMRAKLRTAEVARDDAELRFLEADEVITGFRNLLNGFRANADEMIRATVKPQEAPAESTSAPIVPSAEVSISPNVIGVAVASDMPTTLPEVVVSKAIPLSESAVSEQVVEPSQDGADGGVTEGGGVQPASPFVDGSQGAELSGVHSDSVKPEESVASPKWDWESDLEKAKAERPYEGKYYINVPGMISLAEWLAGGGTEFTYHYRRA